MSDLKRECSTPCTVQKRYIPYRQLIYNLCGTQHSDFDIPQYIPARAKQSWDERLQARCTKSQVLVASHCHLQKPL